MKFYRRLLLMLTVCISVGAAFGQADNSVNDLIKQGKVLSEQQKYNEAIVKYKDALIAEPGNPGANYEIAYALYSVSKGAEGIPYLQQAIAANKNTAFAAGAYSLLGSIYSAANQFQRAIEAYQNGIKADSTNQRLYYNLGITQYRAKQYADAGQSFIAAIKIDTAYAASQRMYALTAFHQNKRVDALFGFCRYLMIEPAGPTSAEAFGNLKNILSGGSLKPEPGYKPSATVKAAAAEQNKLLTKALAGFATRRYASATDLLAAQLKAVFGASGNQPDGKYPFANYFCKLSQTAYFPTFVRMISQRAMPENAKWVTANADQVAVYKQWETANKVTF